MFMKQIRPLTLASQSPRRLTLLRRVGMDPAVISKSYAQEETVGDNLKELAQRNAQLKFEGASPHFKDQGWLLSADTLVGIDDRLLGKPADANEAREMLTLLSGATHQVVTAYCFGVGGEKQPRLTRAVESAVTFRVLTPPEIETYIESGEPMDKAGAYGIQGAGLQFITQVQGSSSNVMGLPMYETVMDLVRLQIALFAGSC